MLRIQWTGLTVKALHKRLQQAYTAGDKRLVRRLSVLLAVGQHKAKVLEVAQQWSLSSAIVYQWRQDFLVERLASLPYRWSRGRPSKRSSVQVDIQPKATLVPPALVPPALVPPALVPPALVPTDRQGAISLWFQ
jgi:hypothetical protein